MGEFKGTKGKWVTDKQYDISTEEGKPVLDCGCGCCSYHDVSKEDLHLMSKSPEMLELLQEIDHFLNCDFNVGEKHTKIKQLIKEVTEI